MRSHRKLAIAVGGALFSGNLLFAQVTHTWDSSASGTQQWHILTNWTGDADAPGDGVATGNQDVAVFSTAGTSATIGLDFSTLSTPYYLGGITHSSTTRTIGSSGLGAGTLVFNSIQTSGLLISNTSTSNTLTFAPTVSGGVGNMSISLGNSGTINVANSGATVNITAIVGEAVVGRNIVKSGAGTLSLGAQNTFTGGLTINSAGGTVTMGVDSTGSPGSVSSGPIGTGIITINGGAVAGSSLSRVLHNNVTVGSDFAINSLNLAGGIGLGGVTRVITTGSSGGTLSGVISGSPGVGISKAGTSTLTISNSANTFVGGLTVTAGTIQLTGNATGAASSTLGPGALTINAGGITSNNTTVRTVTNNVVVGGNFGFASITFDGTSFNLGSVARTISTTGTGNTISAPISNTAGGLTKSGSGALVLTNNLNSYVGGTTLSQGTLIISDSAQLGAASTAITLNGGTFDATGSSAIGLNRPVTMGGGTISVSNNSAAGLQLTGVVSGSGVINQIGAGTVTLSNTGNNFSNAAGWTVRSGTLALGASNVFPNTLGVTLSTTGSALSVGGNSESLAIVSGLGSILLATGGSLSMMPTAAGTFTGSITGTGQIIKAGGSTLNFGGTVAADIGYLTLPNAGYWRMFSSTAVPSGTGSMQLSTGVTISAAFPSPSQSNFLSHFDAASLDGIVALEADTANPFDFSSVFGSASTVRFASGGFASQYYDAAALTPQGNTYLLGGANGTMTISNGVLVDGISPRGLSMGGSSLPGTTKLDGPNTYTGPTDVTAGTLIVGAAPQNAGTPSPLGSNGNITVGGSASAATLSFLTSGTTNRSVFVGSNGSIAVASGRSVTLTSGVGGSGSLVKNGTGILVLAGSAGYAGTTFIDGGILSISDANQVNPGPITLRGGSTSGDALRVTATTTIPNSIVLSMTSGSDSSVVGIDVPGGVTATFDGDISNSGATASTGGLAKYGDGTMISTFTNTLRGGVTVFDGNLVLSGTNGAMTFATGNNNVVGSGLAVDRGASFTLDNGASNNNSRMPSAGSVSLNGGSFNLIGNASVNSSATIGSLFASAPATLTVTPGSASTAARLNVASLSTVANPLTALLIRGSNLGTAAPGTAGVASVVPTNWVVSGGGGAMGTPTVSLLYHAIADTSSTGLGSGFAVVDPATGVRPLSSSEYATTFTPGSDVRLNLKATAATPTNDRPTLVNSLYMSSGVTLNSSELLVPLAASVFQEAGRGTINGGYLASPNGANMMLWTTGTLVSNGAVHSSNGFNKGGAGKLEVNGPLVVGGAFMTIGGGTVAFGPSANLSRSPRLAAYGSYIDLSGADREIGGLSGAQQNGLVIGGATVNIGSNRLTLGRSVAGQVWDGMVIGNGDLYMVQGGLNTGGGTQVFSAPQPYSGSTNVLGGTLQLAGASGALPNTSAINLRGGTLRLQNLDNGDYSFINDNRLPDTAPITVNGGELRLAGNASAPSQETVGGITADGAARVTLELNGGAVRLDAASLTRSSRGTFQLLAENAFQPGAFGGRPGLASLNMFLATPPTLVGAGGAAGTPGVSILPWATGIRVSVAGPGLLTYDATRGLRPLDINTEFSEFVEGSSTTNNVKITNSISSAGGTTTVANSFMFNGGFLNFGPGVGTITPTSGAIVLGGSNNIALQTTINFAAVEGIIHGGGTIDGPIHGSQGVTFAEGFFAFPPGGNFQNSGTLTFNRASMFVDLSTGLSSAQPLAFSSGADPLDVSDGVYDASATPDVVLNNNINLRSGATKFYSNTPGGNFTLGGDLTGPGGLSLRIDKVFQLTGNNTYTGPTVLTLGATLQLEDDGDLGNGGDLVWSNGTVQLTGNWTANRDHYINSGGNILDTNGFQATFNNGLYGATGNGGASLTKLGDGTLILNAQGDTRAGLAITQGAVRVRNSYGLGAPSGGGTFGGGTTTVSSGAQLQFDNNISVDNFVNLSGTGIGGTGALLNYGGNNTITNTITLSANSSIGANPGTRLRVFDGITGGFAVTKVGGGVLELLTGMNYAGGTTVDAGTLLANNFSGSATGTGAVQIDSGATLGGAGTITGVVTAQAGATIAPGNSVGVLTTGGTDLQTGSNFRIEIDFVGNTADRLNVLGSVNLNGVGGGSGVGSVLQFTFVSGTTPTSAVQKFILISNDGGDGVAGTFDGVANGVPQLLGMLQYVVEYNATDAFLGADGNDVIVSFSQVPEPGATILLPLLWGLRRRVRWQPLV